MSRWLWLLVGPVLGAAIVLIGTRDGPQMRPDSAVYVGVADNVASGRGVTVPFHFYPLGGSGLGTPPPQQSVPRPTPLTQYAPLTPVVLSVWRGHAKTVAVALNAGLLAGTALMAGWAVWAVTGSRTRALAAQVAIVSSVSLLTSFTAVLSDPMFVFASLLALLLLASHLRRPSGYALIGSAATTAVALLARYSGIGVVLTAVVLLLARRRIGDVALFVVVSCVPIGIWLGRQQAGVAHATNRQTGFHPVAASLTQAVRPVAAWVLPDRLPGPARTVVALAVVTGVVWVARAGPALVVQVAGIFVLSYALTLVATATFVDQTTTPDDRLLLPVLVAVIIAVFASLPEQLPILATMTALVILSLLRAVVYVVPDRNDALNYGSRLWLHSPIMIAAGALPADRPLYTNAPDAFYAVLHRATSTIPEKTDFTSGSKNPSFRIEEEEMGRTVAARGGFIVYIPDGRPFVPTESELRRDLPLRTVSAQPDGTIYQSS
jgi:hypothetical protein